MKQEISSERFKGMLRVAYRMTDKYSNYCPPDCQECEMIETLLLLPGEEDLILKRLGQVHMCQRNFRKDSFGNCYEPSNSNCTMLSQKGTCTIYEDRPLDCRSFPIVPHFSLSNINDIEFFVSDAYCPLGKDLTKLPAGFIFDTVKMWKYLLPGIHISWRKRYNEINAKSYRHELSQNLCLGGI
jgi:Fe-S-cluster containining protein